VAELRSIVERRRSVLAYSQCSHCGAPIDRERVLVTRVLQNKNVFIYASL